MLSQPRSLGAARQILTVGAVFMWTSSDCLGSALGGLCVNIVPTVTTVSLPVN